MNRSRQRVEVLRQIAGIRAISTRLAEAKCVAANRDVVIAQDKQQLEQRYLRDAVSGWEGVMLSPRFDPDSSVFWGHAINQAVSQVDVAANEVADRRAVLEQSEKHMAGMIANDRCADALLSKARKKHLSESENRYLAEQSDQITRSEMRRCQ
jgi:hypothetical protein